MNISNAALEELPFTGERYVPSLQGTACLDHWARYSMAREFASGRRVLDIACGEGYGSAFLSEVALSVTGVDISSETVAHAVHRYARPNLEFRVGTCAAMPIADGAMDFVVSFETLEHHDQHDEMLRETKRVLRPGGLLMVSSPDRLEYSKVDPNNPFHVKELCRHEFEVLVKEHFAHVAVFGQRVVFGSCIIPETVSAPLVLYTLAEPPDGRPQRHDGLAQSLFLVALASDRALPKIVSTLCEKRIGFDVIEKIWPSESDAMRSQVPVPSHITE